MSKGKKSKVYYEVRCQKHGNMNTNKDTRAMSLVGNPPAHKRGLQSGCPVCKAKEKKNE